MLHRRGWLSGPTAGTSVRSAEKQGVVSRVLGARGFGVDAVEGPAGRDEQPVFLQAAEAEVRAGFWQVDLPEQVTVGAVAVHAVEAGPAVSGCRPHVPVPVGADAVRFAWAHLDEYPP